MIKVGNHVILWLDVLGYSEHIKSFTTLAEQNQYLDKIHSLMKNLSGYITRRNKLVDNNQDKLLELNLSRWKWIAFSDNILFFAPYEDECDAGNLYDNLLYGISEFYMQYRWDDIFIRGALTKGKLYYDKKLHFVFGSGLVRAHELESGKDKAIYPRILIDSELKPSPILVGYDKDENDDWYFNYLDLFYALCYYEKSNDLKQQFLLCLKNHRDNIVKANKKYGSVEKLAIKYKWLTDFHNRFCKIRGFEDYIIG